MDNDLKQALLDMLNGVKDAAGQGKDFVLEQAPLVVLEKAVDLAKELK